MIGFPLNPSLPMAEWTFAGKFGGFLHVDDARLMNSQVSVEGSSPPQISSLEKPINQNIKFKDISLEKAKLG